MTSNAESTLVEYFRHLDNGDADAAVALFSEGAVYIRQFLGADGELAYGSLTGRDELRQFLEGRGRQPYRHLIRRVVTDGEAEIAEGVVSSGPDSTPVVFMASALLDDRGLIRRYLALAVNISAGILEKIESSRGAAPATEP